MVEKGDRIEITNLVEGDPVAEVGDQGTVDYILDPKFSNRMVGKQIFIRLDKGGNLALLPDKGDTYKIIEESD